MREEMREMREKIREKMRPAPGRTCLRRPYRRGPRTVDHEQPVRNGLELTGDGGLRRGFTWQAGIGSSVGEASLGAACGDAARWTVGASCVRRVRRRRRCGGAMAVSGRRPRGGCAVAVRCPLEGPGAGARWASHHFAQQQLRRSWPPLYFILLGTLLLRDRRGPAFARPLAPQPPPTGQPCPPCSPSSPAISRLPSRPPQPPTATASRPGRTTYATHTLGGGSAVLRAPCSVLRAPRSAHRAMKAQAKRAEIVHQRDPTPPSPLV